MDHVLIALALAALYVLFVIASPAKPCRCAGRCRRCKGTGRRFRFGARIVHKALAAARRARGERK